MTEIMLPSAFVYFPSEGTMPCKLQPRATAAKQGSLEFTQTTWQTDARKSDPCVLTVLQSLDNINCWLSQNLSKLNDDNFDVLVIKSTTLTHSTLSLLSKNVKQSTHNQWFSTLSCVSMLKLKKMPTTLTPDNSECGWILTGTRICQYITPVLGSLHWLAVKFHVYSKSLLMTCIKLQCSKSYERIVWPLYAWMAIFIVEWGWFVQGLT